MILTCLSLHSGFLRPKYSHLSTTIHTVYAFPLPHMRYTPAYLIPLDFINQTIFGEQYRSLSSSLYSSLHTPVTLSFLGPNILLSTLFSNTLSLRSSLNVSDQVSHPYKTTSKICSQKTTTVNVLIPHLHVHPLQIPTLPLMVF